MKESVLDILIYLFENYFDADIESAPEPDIGVEVILEEINENIENTFLHFTTLGRART